MTPLVKVIEGPRLTTRGIPTVVGKITIGQLATTHRIPHRKSGKQVGYQREASLTRVNSLARDIDADRVDLPTAILVNRRGLDMSHLIPNDDGSLCLPISCSDDPFYIVDGQHRLNALCKLFEADPSKWENYELPFVCMIGATESQEMEQFHVVNSNAKSVSTDLALVLLKQRAEHDTKMRMWLEERGQSWKLMGQQIVDKLKDTPAWRGRIRYPNEQKGRTTIGNSAVVASLKRPLSQENFNGYSMDDKLKILDAYWQGIRTIYRDAFDDNPTEFNVQKTVGVHVFHALLPTVLQLALAKPSVTDRTIYAEILRGPLESIEGDNPQGEFVSGIDFWRVGTGAAGTYSSESGRRVLIMRIRGALPTVEIV